MRLSCSQVMKLQAVLSLLVTGGCFAFLLTCDPVLFAGVTASYNYSLSVLGDEGSSSYNLTDSCNIGCDCSQVLYEPVCSELDNVQYYSPCHAGCLNMNDDREYFNCSCVSAYSSGDEPGSGAAAVLGTCSNSICWEAILFIVLFFFAVLFIFVCMTFTMTATLRSVKSNQSNFAYSLQILAVKILGTIPGPLFIGLAFDESCTLWDEECGVKGSCMSYDVPELSLTIFFICIAVKGLASIMAILSVVVYKPPHQLPHTAPHSLSSSSRSSSSSSSSDSSLPDLTVAEVEHL